MRILRTMFTTVKPNMELLKQLRNQTNAPLGDCKKALEETIGDYQLAVTWLRDKGLLSAGRRIQKQTREGVIASFVSPCHKKVVLAEINCQTDFVAKNDIFLKFSKGLCDSLLQSEHQFVGGQSVQQINQYLSKKAAVGLFPADTSIKNMSDEHKIMISRLQENIRVRRIMTLHSDTKYYGAYVHRNYTSGIGLQACVVELEAKPQMNQEVCAETNTESQASIEPGAEADLNESQRGVEAVEGLSSEAEQIVGEFADNMATQILGAEPKYLSYEEIPVELIEEETNKVMKIIEKGLKHAPVHNHEKMINGRLHTEFYQKYLLGSMPYVMSNERETVGEIWEQAEKEAGVQLKVTRYFIWQCN